MLKVVKRDKSIEDFNVQKVVNAVQKAFASVGCGLPEYLNTMIPALFEEGDVIGVDLSIYTSSRYIEVWKEWPNRNEKSFYDRRRAFFLSHFQTKGAYGN